MGIASVSPPIVGALLPRWEVAVLDPRKLTDYALSRDHPKGRHKARRFEEVLGYMKEDAPALRKSVLDSLAEWPVTEVRDGSTLETWICVVDMELVGPSGSGALVRTLWETTSPPKPPRLVTIFVKDRV